MSTYAQELEEIIDRAEQQGWQARDTQSGHKQLFAPDGRGIVVAPGTPSDHRSIDNFVADLKRHGYKPFNNTEELMAQRRVRGVKGVIEAALRENPTKAFGIHELRDIALTKLPGTAPNATDSALSNMVAAGRIERVSMGVYQWKPDLPGLEPVAQAVPAPAAAQELVDDDERELNEVIGELMDVMGRAEKLLRKYHSIIKQVGALRKLLGS